MDCCTDLTLSSACGDSLWRTAENHDRAGSDPPPHLENSDYAMPAGGILVCDRPLLPKAPADPGAQNFSRPSLVPENSIDLSLENYGAFLGQMDGLSVEGLYPVVQSTAAQPEDMRMESLSRTTQITIKVPKCPEGDKGAAHQENPLADNLYSVEVLLDRWRQDYFYVKWLDGTCSWEPRETIEDRALIKALNKTHRGLNHGVQVLDTRRDSDGMRDRVRWKGGKWKDQWLHEKYLGRELVRQYRPKKKAKRKRRRG
ncbi:hypothetical protein V8F33_012700 [Rhypophila sp. PSN 637]